MDAFLTVTTRNASLKRPVKGARSGLSNVRVATEEYFLSRLFLSARRNLLSFVSHSERSPFIRLETRETIDSQFTRRRAGKAIAFEKTTRRPRTMERGLREEAHEQFSSERTRGAFFEDRFDAH